MTRWCRMRTHASLIVSAAALLASPAGAQEQWRTPTDHRGTQLVAGSDNYRQYDGYGDERLIAPSATSRSRTSASWDNHIDRVAQLESQLESLQTTRVAELEAEVAKMNDKMAASGDALHGMGGGYLGYGSGCCDPCCPPVQRGWYAGFEFLFLKPHFENSTAFISTQNGQIADRNAARSHEIDYGWGLAPRIVVGYTGDSGLGARTRYFYYNHSSNRTSVVVPDGGDIETPIIEPNLGGGEHFFMDNAAARGFTADHRLELQTWDLEVTNQLTFCRSLVTVGGGLRYVLMEQRFRARSWNTPEATELQETLLNMHDFEGIGPTLAVDMLRPLSCCSGLSLYFNARGSALFGESNQSYKKIDASGVLDTEFYSRNGADNSLYIAEVGLGVQYNRGMFFGRGGWEGQYWHGVGGPTTNQGNMGLHGLSLMLGLNY